jgi:hypothetical protein
LKFAHWVPPTTPCTPRRKRGQTPSSRHPTIKIKIFPAQQLGKAFDMARDGIADIAYLNPL